MKNLLASFFMLSLCVSALAENWKGTAQSYQCLGWKLSLPESCKGSKVSMPADQTLVIEDGKGSFQVELHVIKIESAEDVGRARGSGSLLEDELLDGLVRTKGITFKPQAEEVTTSQGKVHREVGSTNSGGEVLVGHIIDDKAFDRYNYSDFHYIVFKTRADAKSKALVRDLLSRLGTGK